MNLNKNPNIIIVALLLVWLYYERHVNWILMKDHEIINSQTGPLYFFPEWMKYVARNQCTFSLFHYRLRQATQGKKSEVK